MVELAEIFCQAAADYRQCFGPRMPPQHRRALHDIALCRTPALGGSLYACNRCGSLEYAYHSCRNRHCPKCQEDRAQRWLERLCLRLLPCSHYLLTFTLPAALRTLARSHQRLVYAALLREAAAAIQALADDPQWLGGRLGILAVLHTWSRTLAYHPHAHLLVTAGGLSPDGSAWRKPRHPRFLVPGYALSQHFRTRMRAALTRAGLAQNIDPCIWSRPWVVHVQQIGTGLHAARYLSRYVYKVALTNDRLECFQNGQVTFRYTPSGSRQTRRMTLPVSDFIARFLQHVLPRGFAKVRYFGLLSPTSAPELEHARTLLQSASAPPNQPPTHPRPAPLSPALTLTPRLCPSCHCGHLILLLTWRPRAPP